jgi:UDP-N-acetyl-2-amino-2-deoxyglucuronate dehydrogenase
MKTFVLIGAAGYVAPKHMAAIKETGGDLIAILDPHDSVGILDSYFPDCKYFSEFVEFEEFCLDNKPDYVVVCSPNYLHFEHCLWALESGIDVICEKPTVLTVGELRYLLVVASMMQREVYSILQLRLGASAIVLKANNIQPHSASLVYYTPRGSWYNSSWKGEIQKSGGLVTAIGVHLLDLLLWLYGPDYSIINWDNSSDSCIGQLNISGTVVTIDLSIRWGNSPERLLIVDGTGYSLSDNFNGFHSVCYQNILDGKGVSLSDLGRTIELCQELRSY